MLGLTSSTRHWWNTFNAGLVQLLGLLLLLRPCCCMQLRMGHSTDGVKELTLYFELCCYLNIFSGKGFQLYLFTFMF